MVLVKVIRVIRRGHNNSTRGKNMEISQRKTGFSLVEVIVTAFILTLVILLIARIFHFNAVIMHKSDLLTTAASLAEDISSKIKDQPFDAVYSFDSDNPHPAKVVYGSPAFKSDAYFVDIDETPMKAVLLDAISRVKSQNFTRLVINVVYVRRDSSAVASIATDGYVEWSNTHPIYGTNGPRSTVPSDNYICDAVDPNVCFRDLNDDGDYWDVVSGIPETPFTGLKMLTISVYKKDEPIGVKRGTILSLGGFSGKEITSAQSPLKLRITRPNSNSFAFQVTPTTKASLELPTRRTYPSYWFDVTNGSHVSQRIDNNSDPVQINQTITVPGGALSPGYTIPGTDANLRVFGITDSGQSGTLETTDIFNSAAFPTSISDEKGFTPSGYDFSIIGSLPTISGPTFMMRDGLHRLWSRKRSTSTPPVYSPYDVRTILVDNGIPQAKYFMYPGPGDRPRIGITISDYFQVDGITPSYYSNLAFQPTSVIVKNLSTGVSSHTWVGSYSEPGRGIWKNWDVGIVNNSFGAFRTYGATTTLRLRDIDGYPWKLNIGDNYDIIWEWGDRAGYKNTTTQNITVNASGAGSGPIPGEDNSPRPGLVKLEKYAGFSFNARKGVKYSLSNFYFTDMWAGIDYPKIKVEVCPESHGVPLDPNMETPGCKTIFSKTENVRPSPAPWGDWIMYGGQSQYFDNLNVWAIFTDPGVGSFTGMDFAIGTTWQIRVYLVNAVGQAVVVGSDSWRFTIVL